MSGMSEQEHVVGHDPACRSAYCDPRYEARPWNASVYRLIEAAQKALRPGESSPLADAVEALQQQIWTVFPEQWAEGRHFIRMEWENVPGGAVRLLHVESGQIL